MVIFGACRTSQQLNSIQIKNSRQVYSADLYIGNLTGPISFLKLSILTVHYNLNFQQDQAAFGMILSNPVFVTMMRSHD
ncbi:hypothetical protein ACH3XW_9520 [Acanthocheilonema viteae]